MRLTGRNMGAEEAERAGLVGAHRSADELVADALKTAATIAGMSKPIAQMTKEAVNRVDEVSLSEGIRFERRVFHAMLRDGRPEGRHGGVRREASAEFKHR